MPSEPPVVRCIAILHDNGQDLTVFDASGRPRTYSCEDCPGKLCFSSHGAKGLDGLLTPCLDEDGLHGVPDEGCFCGVDTPHIHAHLQDDVKCLDLAEDGCKRNQALEMDIGFLASVTLHPKKSNGNLPTFPITDVHPEQCNSAKISEHCQNLGIPSKNKAGKCIAQIQHGDHIDNLIHSINSNILHLEHSCDSCGEEDLHGVFDLVTTRTLEEGIEVDFFQKSSLKFNINDFLPKIFHLQTLGAIFDVDSADRVNVVKKPKKRRSKCCSDPTCKANLIRKGSTQHEETTDVRCKYESEDTQKPTAEKPIPNKPDCCASGACDKNISTSDTAKKICESESVKSKSDCCAKSGGCQKRSAKTGIPEPSSGRQIRSGFHCNGICCESEIPIITTVLEPVDGIHNISFDIPSKSVFVDHNPSIISPDQINQILNKGGFESTLSKGDFGTVETDTAVGRSQFFVEKICCASEVPVIQKILEPHAGIIRVSINVTNKITYVEHDTAVISAQNICDILNAEHFGAQIKLDAKESMEAPLISSVQSILSFKDSSLSETENQALSDFLSAYSSTQIKSFVVDVSAKKLRILHDPLTITPEEICVSLRSKFSINIFVEEDGAVNLEWQLPEIKEEEDIEEETAKYPRPTVILSGIFWLLSLLSLIGGKWDYLKYLSIVALVFGLPPIARKAYSTLCRCQFDTNVLMFSAAVGAVALQEFTEAGAVAFLFSLSEWLEARATARARNALSAIVQLRPDKANLIHPSTRDIIVVPASAVPIGALVRVKTGDKIPCDGVVVQGTSTVNESSLTGESRPVLKAPMDEVSGGTVNSGMVDLLVRTTCTTENSAVSRLIRLVEEAQANRSETEKIVDTFARYYTPVVIFVALCMVTIPWAFGPEIGRLWTNNGLVLLVVACPCALIISTPVTYVAGLAAAAQKGVLIKGGTHLETLGMVKKIAFDKTGTLTCGEFALLHLETIENEMKRLEILEMLALVEERAHHPLAQAIVAGIKNEGIELSTTSDRIENTTNIAGEGVTASVDGFTVYVGNERLFTRLGMSDALPADIKSKSDRWASEGDTVGFMGIEGFGIVAAYSVADSVRPESARVVESLCKLHVEVTMLTGDNADAARTIGRQLGLEDEHIRSQLLPEEKLEIVEAMKQEELNYPRQHYFKACKRNNGKVMFCGDGVNDGPALTIAHVGIAMGAGAALAMETSDVTLLDSNLEKLIYAMKLGKRVIQKIRENIVFSFLVKGIVVGFTLAGSVHLWVAIATDVGAMILVTLNGMTLLPYRKRTSELVNNQEQV